MLKVTDERVLFDFRSAEDEVGEMLDVGRGGGWKEIMDVGVCGAGEVQLLEVREDEDGGGRRNDPVLVRRESVAERERFEVGKGNSGVGGGRRAKIIWWNLVDGKGLEVRKEEEEFAEGRVESDLVVESGEGSYGDGSLSTERVDLPLSPRPDPIPNVQLQGTPDGSILEEDASPSPRNGCDSEGIDRGTGGDDELTTYSHDELGREEVDEVS